MTSLTSNVWLRSIVMVWLAGLASACSLLGGVRVEAIAVAARKPSNVALYVQVRDGAEPVANLSASNFRAYENGQLVPSEQSQLMLLPHDSAASYNAVLLVDMSGTPAEIERHNLGQAVSAFVKRVREQQDVVVYAFSGTGKLSLIGEYQKSRSAPAPDLSRLLGYSTRDTSRDLNGSVLEGLKRLDARLKSSQRPLRLGTLVVYSRGPDLTGRDGASKLDDALDDTAHSVFAIAMEGQSDLAQLERLGREGLVLAQSPEGTVAAFEEAAERIAANVGGHYLVSYCSPARAGARAARLEVEFTRPDGVSATGSVSHEFDATGFSSGCDPKTTPRFPPKKTSAADGPVGSGAPASEPREVDEVVPPPDKPGYVQ